LWRRLLGFGLVTLLASLGAWTAPAGALAASATKVVHYRGYSLAVPESWPVYRLDTHPMTCVRFNRHAVYLGRPGIEQRCPAHAAGRTEAILVEPLQARASGAAAGATGAALPAPSAVGAAAGDRSSAQLVNAARGVVVTATWSRHPAVIRRALDVRSLVGVVRGGPRPAPTATAANALAQPGQVYRGLGFDPCSTPSSGQMSAWGASPYRAIGVYLGGANLACSQPNLTAAWVSRESAAGWHLIPTYVGLQAPSNSCGCASISPGSAASEGAAAARDAIAQAQAVGLGAGNPIYDDMEAYNPGGSTPAVLSFLAAWTARLHASGYKSGVYSSSSSGIADLASRYGTGYLEPDDLWIANWNGVRNTADPNVPSGDWVSHQRLHQYNGGVDETYGGVTINIDGDYLDGATAAAGSFAPALAAAPTLSVSPAADGSIDLYPSWLGSGQVSSWQVMAGTSPTSLTALGQPVAASNATEIVVHNAYHYFAVRAFGAAGQLLGTSPPAVTRRFVAIFGARAFVPRQGLAELPVGCFSPVPCLVTTTITTGRRRLVKTGPEVIPVSGGFVYYNLSPTGRTMLNRAKHHRLHVQITVRDASGISATRQLNLIRFATSGPNPAGAVTQSQALRIIGGTDFVSAGGTGGTLAACFAASPCNPSTTITAAGTVIAHTTAGFLGVNELGYVPFTLTAAGHTLLTRAPGNQLPATVAITTGGATATAQVALVSFN